MSDRVELYVLAVGQGSCNLVATYDGNRMLKLDLIDCGSMGGKISSETLQNQMEFIRKLMRNRASNMKKESVEYYLDHLIISHADADHINLLRSNYFLNGLIPKNTRNDLAYFLFPDANHKVLGGKEVLLTYKKECGGLELYTYRIDLSNEGIDRDQVVDAELVLEWRYREEGGIFNKFGENICYQFFDENQCASVFVFFKGDSQDELHLEKMTCKIEDANYIYVFETAASVWGFYSIAKQTSKEHKASLSVESRDEEAMLEWMKSVLELREDNTILNFIEKARSEVKDIQDVTAILNLEYAKSILEHGEREEGNCIINEVIIGGLSRAAKENKAGTDAILIELRKYNDYGVIYMETTGNRQLDETTYLQKLRQDDYRKALKGCRWTCDENSGSITYSAKFFDQWIVLPGDATGDTMWYFVNELWHDQNVPKGAWMTAPHHGADVSTFSKTFDRGNRLLDAYLKKIKPRGIIISAGYGNRYGHPHKAFLETAQQYTAESQAGENCLICSSGQGNPWEEQPVGKNIFACLEKIKDENFYCGYFNRKVTFLSDGTVVNEKCDELTMFETPPTPMASIENPEQGQNQELASAMFGTERGFDFLIGESSEV